MLSVPFTRSVAEPASALTTPALLRPCAAFSATTAPRITAVAALSSLPPALTLSVWPACVMALAPLEKSDDVATARSPSANSAPWLSTLPVANVASPRECIVPAFTSAPVTVTVSFAVPCCESSQAPLLFSVPALTVLAVAACTQPVAELSMLAARSASVLPASNLPLLLTLLSAALPSRSAMSSAPAALTVPELDSAPSARTVTAPLSAVIVPAFDIPLPAVSNRLPPCDCSTPPVAVLILPLDVSAMLPADCSTARPSARSPLSALAISAPPLL